MRLLSRRIRVLWAAVLLVSLVAACIGPQDDSERGPITLLQGRDTTSGQQIRALVNQWNLQHPDERVDYVDLKEGTDNERRGLLEAAASSSPKFDVFGLDVIWVAEFARAGFLRELNRDDLELDEFLRLPRQSVEVDGKIWAVPAHSNAALLYYRKDLLEEADYPKPPENWPELANIAKMVQAKHPEIGGYAGQYDRYEGLVVNLFEAVWAAGGEVISEDGKQVLIGEPKAREGLTRLVDSVKTGLVPPQAQPYKEEEGIKAFAEGRLVFMRGWPSAYARLNDQSQSQVAEKVRVTPLPGPSVLGGNDLAISSHSRHPKTALDFIKFMTSKDSQRRLLENSTLPPTRAALYEDNRLLGDKNKTYIESLKRALENAKPRPATEHYADISQAIADEVYKVLFPPTPMSTDQAVDTAVAALVPKLRKILEH